MPLAEGFLKINSSDLSLNNFCPVNVLNLVVKLILSDPECFRATQFTFDESFPSRVTSVVIFDIEDVNRVNCVFKF